MARRLGLLGLLLAAASASAEDFFGSESVGDAVIENLSEGTTFNDQSTAGNASISNALSGSTTFNDQSTAGNASITNTLSGSTAFNDQSTAGNATIINGDGGFTIFNGQSSAGNATITSDDAGSTSLLDNSSAGNARLIALGSGSVDFSEGSGPAGDNRHSAGSIEGSGTFGLGSALLSVGSNNLSTEVSGSLVGDVDGSLIKLGSGTLTISGDNSNSLASGILIQDGLINFNSGASLGSGSISLDGGGLQWATGTSTDISSRLTALGGNGGIFDTNGNEVTLEAAIGGSGALTKSGNGVLVLNGANAYSGGTLVAAGVLRQGSAGALVGGGAYSINGGTLDLNGFDLSMGSLSGTGGTVVLGAGSLSLDQAGDSTYAGTIAGAGSLSKLGAGSLTLSGSNSYGGGTFVTAGVLRQGSAGALVGGGAYRVDGGTLDLNGFDLSMGSLSGTGGTVALGAADLSLDQAGDSTYAGSIAGTGSLSKLGAGTLTLAGSNSYSGGTRLEAGTLRQGASGALPAGTAYAINGGTLDLNGFALQMSALSGGGGQIATGGVSLTVNQTGSSSYAGGITGSGGLIKSGAGRLELSAAHSYLGPTEVQGGTLAVNGALAPSSGVRVRDGATLGGTGTVGSVLLDAGGILAPGNSIGTLNVDGDLIFDSASIYQVETDTAGNADRVLVSGLANLAGTVQVLAENGDYAPDTRYTILSSGGPLSGQFDAVTSNLAFLDPSLSYASNDVFLTLTRNDLSFQSLALTPNQLAFAGAAETLDSADPVYQTLLNQSEAQAPDTFARLSGDAHASFASALLLDDLGLSQMPLGNLRRNLDSPGKELPYWVQVNGGRQRIDSDGNAGQVVQDHQGTMFGGDLPAFSDWRLGGALGYGQEQLDVGDREAKADADSYRYVLYGGRDLKLARWTLKLFGGAGYSQRRLDSRRQVELVDGAERLASQYDVTSRQAFGELAYHLDLSPPAYIEPFVGLLRIDQHNEGFDEGGGAAALSADSQRSSLLSSTLGMRGQQLFKLAERDLLVNGAFTWRHIEGDLRPDRSFTIGASEPFKVLGTTIPNDSVLVELNLDYALTPNVVLDVDYNGVFSSSSQANQVAFNLRWRM